jgi:acyl-coenzyme A thioesterase PaaI-like protein
LVDHLDDTVQPSASLRSFVDAMRDVIRTLVRVDTSASIDELASRMRSIDDDLGRHATLGDSQPENMRRTRNPTSGVVNPIAPPTTPQIVDNRIVATVTFNDAYQGPPSVVHGGFVAAVLDEALGRTRHLTEHNVVTGSLQVKYIRPTPVNVELVAEAWIDEIQERKMISRGVLRHGEVVTAEAEGTFVFLAKDRFMDLVGDARLKGNNYE